MMRGFDDSLLDDVKNLAARGHRVEFLAHRGARLRTVDPTLCAQVALDLVRPRAVIAIGAEARLLRALVESVCPVPFIAWTLPTLPIWVGVMDLVIVLAGSDETLAACVAQATARGAQVVVVAPFGSQVLEMTAPGSAIVVEEEDPFTQAMLALKTLNLAQIGPQTDLSRVADALDEVAEHSGPRHPLGDNPAKDMACALAETVPLICGGSPLAARAARRVAEAIREATLSPALAADDVALVPLLEGAGPSDLFADPFDEPGQSIRFSVLIFDDGESPLQGIDIARLAQAHRVRVESIRYPDGPAVVRYAQILQQGMYAAAYLELASVGE